MVSHWQPDQRAGPEVRVSDAEREEIAQALGRHHAEGRLDTAELDQRLDLAYGAKTRGELGSVVSDLPSGPRALPNPLPVPRRDRIPVLTGFAVLAFGLLVATSLVSDHHLVWGTWWIVWIGLWIVRPWRHRPGPARRYGPGGEVGPWHGQSLS